MSRLTGLSWGIRLIKLGGAGRKNVVDVSIRWHDEVGR
jgi:hypothetical protein